MPLQAISEALGLSDAVTRANEPSFIFAETINLGGLTVLLTYRSPLVKDSHPLYQHVAALLARHDPELIHSGTVDDEAMMWGEGRWETHLLHPRGGLLVIPTDPEVVTVIDLIRNWGKPFHPLLVCEEVRRRLTVVRS